MLSNTGLEVHDFGSGNNSDAIAMESMDEHMVHISLPFWKAPCGGMHAKISALAISFLLFLLHTKHKRNILNYYLFESYFYVCSSF